MKVTLFDRNFVFERSNNIDLINFNFDNVSMTIYWMYDKKQPPREYVF